MSYSKHLRSCFLATVISLDSNSLPDWTFVTLISSWLNDPGSSKADYPILCQKVNSSLCHNVYIIRLTSSYRVGIVSSNIIIRRKVNVV